MGFEFQTEEDNERNKGTGGGDEGRVGKNEELRRDEMKENSPAI